MHIICCIAGFSYRLLIEFSNFKMLGSMYLYIATVSTLVVVLYVQSAYATLNLCSRNFYVKGQDSSIKQWFFFELSAFILNIISMAVFLLISWIKSYRTIRERVGLAFESGVFCRKEADYFSYCLEDMSYFTNWFIVFMLNVVATKIRVQKTGFKSIIRVSFGVLMVMNIIYVYIM